MAQMKQIDLRRLPSVATPKPAMYGHLKTGHMKRRPGQGFLLLQD
jgi:hypothetical protein